MVTSQFRILPLFLMLAVGVQVVPIRADEKQETEKKQTEQTFWQKCKSFVRSPKEILLVSSTLVIAYLYSVSLENERIREQARERQRREQAEQLREETEQVRMDREDLDGQIRQIRTGIEDLDGQIRQLRIRLENAQAEFIARKRVDHQRLTQLQEALSKLKLSDPPIRLGEQALKELRELFEKRSEE